MPFLSTGELPAKSAIFVNGNFGLDRYRRIKAIDR